MTADATKLVRDMELQMKEASRRAREVYAMSEDELEAAYIKSLERRKAAGDSFTKATLERNVKAYRAQRRRRGPRQERIAWTLASEEVAERKEARRRAEARE